MTIGSILLGLALLILLGLYVARPFLKRNKIGDHPLTERERLLNEKDAILVQIQLLDFDAETGKIPTEVHDAQRQEMVLQAAQILQALDEYDAHPSVLDAEIETAVAQLRQKDTAVPVSTSLSPNGKNAYCPQCGNPTDPTDKFCVNCGHKLPVKTPQPIPS